MPGCGPEVLVSGVDEEALLAAAGPGADPESVVLALASAKADAAGAALRPPSDRPTVLVACDSMLLVDGSLVGKPSSPAEALARWAVMAGSSGRLLTGHAVRLLGAGDGAVRARAGATTSTTVRFGRPSPAELTAYVASGEPLGVAGAFTLDGLGGPFVEGIEGCPSNVVGLSLPTLRRLLAEVGVALTDLWTDTARQRASA